MINKNDQVKHLYNKSAKNPIFYYLNAIIGQTTENSNYRKESIDLLKLGPNSIVLDAACGLGDNFKIIEHYLQNGGKLIGVDISQESLKLAKGKVLKNRWKNVQLVNNSIIDYKPDILFDAILCTYAKEIIPDYKLAIDKIFDLLKPNGRFSMIGMKLSSKTPYKYLNFIMNKIYKIWDVEANRDIFKYILSKFKRIIYYREYFYGFYYILNTSKMI